MQTSRAEKQLAPAEVGLLEGAFERFAEASRRLEERYDLLSKETELLRRRLEEKEEELRRSEKLAALGETAAGIAHEVRNPLGAMRLFVSLLRRDLADRPEALKLVAEVEKSITSLDQVVANILSFAKNDAIKMGPVNIHAIANELVALFERGLGKEAQYFLDLKGAPFVIGNEQGLRQVLYNLLLNALQATQGRGRIDLQTMDEGEFLVVKVRDNGPGIADDLRPRIFEPFVTNKNNGTGLGLAIVRRILGQHQSEISVANDQGALFTMRLKRRPGQRNKKDAAAKDLGGKILAY